MSFVTTITSGNARLLGSGVFLTFDDSPVQIRFGEKDEPLTLVMEFSNQEPIENQSISSDVVDEKTIKLSLNNFLGEKGAFGTGPKSPVEIGIHNGRKLYFSFTVNTFAMSRRAIIQYSFYEQG